jgi:hypothetical protein
MKFASSCLLNDIDARLHIMLSRIFQAGRRLLNDPTNRRILDRSAFTQLLDLLSLYFRL